MPLKIDPAVLVIGFVQAIVSDPDAVTVSTFEGGEGIVIAVRVSKKDLGRVIGASGRTARALRILLRAIRQNDSPEYALDLDAHPDPL
jgi:predicted RNA-binding protein YlqC (UPF0109 family)